MSESASAAGIAKLEAARAELEAALSVNPQWRALIADADPASREQCERDLAGDPLYRSWRAVTAAIETLRSGGDEVAPRGNEAADQAEPVPQRAIALADILAAIRMDAPTRDGEPPLAIAAEVKAPAAPDAAAGVDGAEPPASLEGFPETLPDGAASAAEPTPPSAQDADTEAPPSAAQTSRIPTVAASSHVNTDASERASRLEEERRRQRRAAGAGLDADDATVTFVIRERSSPPATSATTTATTMPARPTQAAHATRGNEGYVPHDSRANEAEVVVIKHGDNGTRIVESHLAKRGSMRRLLRSLTGG